MWGTRQMWGTRPRPERPTFPAIYNECVPVTVARLRRWFGLAAVVVVLLVAGFYFYGRLRMRNVVEQARTKLGVEIQQTSQGFSLSKSEGGRTLFTVRASNATQYKQGGRAELRDVTIVVYGRTSNRFDQIYGSDFMYDPQTGNIVTKGEVHIDLEGNAEGAMRPDQAPPDELKNPIHLKTTNLVFNKDSGLARTDQQIEFRIPQASGTAVGAIYNSKTNVMTLASDVRIHATGPEPADITASRGVITKDPRRAVLDQVQVVRTGGTMNADHVTIFLREDNSVERMLALGNVRLSKPGATTMLASAPEAELAMTERSALRSATLSGGVSLDATGERPMRGRAARVLVDFGPGNKVDKVHAIKDVRLVQQPSSSLARNPATSQAAGQTVELDAEAMDFLVKNGDVLQSAETSGAAQIVLTQPAAAGGSVASSGTGTRTVVTAGQFVGTFDAHNRLQNLEGSPNSQVVSLVPGQPQKTSTADNLTVSFGPDGQVLDILQTGNFHYKEAQRAAWAGRAEYTPADQMLLLTGAPRVVETGMATTADLIRLNRQSGQMAARGEVKTTYSELKAQPNGALLATADPVHVTAREMSAYRASGVARYSGDARLWQGANIVQAPVIEFDRQHRTIVALPGTGRVSTVFVQRGKNGKITPVNVTADRLNYTDTQRQAHFQGGVIIRGADATMTADQVDVFLHSQTQGNAAVGPSELDHIVAQGHVLIQEPNRRAQGDKLVYAAAQEKFVLTGGPPSIFDAEHGTTTGDSLTFFSRDDRVLVEGKTSPTVTQTRVTTK